MTLSGNRARATGLALGLISVLLASHEVSAGELYVLHHVRDAVCRTFPCPNWSGVNVRTGDRFQFDSLFGAPFGSEASRFEFERQARTGGVLVERVSIAAFCSQLSIGRELRA